MIHAGDTGEPRRLRGAGALDQLLHGQPHLRQKDPELERALHGQLLLRDACGIGVDGTLVRPPMTRAAEDIHLAVQSHRPVCAPSPAW